MITISNVSYKYGVSNHHALSGINLSISNGEFVSIVGGNGCGKSTLLGLINGTLLPSTGQVCVDGVDTAADTVSVRRKVGMVFQNPENQLVASTVLEDTAFGPENLGLPREIIGERVEFALNAVGMHEFRNRFVHTLSGGQKQRVAIAGVVAMQPQHILFDESTAMLDPLGRKESVELMHHLNKQLGATIVMATHFVDETVESDRIVVLKAGEVVLEAPPSQAFSERQILSEAGVGIPVVADLVYLLRAKGVMLDKTVLTVERFIENLVSKTV